MRARIAALCLPRWRPSARQRLRRPAFADAGRRRASQRDRRGSLAKRLHRRQHAPIVRSWRCPARRRRRFPTSGGRYRARETSPTGSPSPEKSPGPATCGTQRPTPRRRRSITSTPRRAPPPRLLSLLQFHRLCSFSVLCRGLGGGGGRGGGVGGGGGPAPGAGSTPLPHPAGSFDRGLATTGDGTAASAAPFGGWVAEWVWFLDCIGWGVWGRRGEFARSLRS